MLSNRFPYRCLGCGTEYAEKTEYCFRACGKFGLVYPADYRPVEDLWTGEAVIPASDFIKHVPTVLLPPYGISVGRRFIMVIYGPPNAGKTTMLIRIGDAADVVVLYVSNEQGDSDSIRSRFYSLEACREGLFVCLHRDVASIDRDIEKYEARMVLIDSLTTATLTLADLKALSRDREVSVIATAQVNSLGNIRGGMGPKHDAEIVIRTQDMCWAIEKTRFAGGNTSGEVL